MSLVVLVLYSAWISPFEFAFLTYKKDGLFIVDHVVNSFFAIDIVLNFFVAYLDSHAYLLVDDPKKIAIRSEFFSREVLYSRTEYTLQTVSCHESIAERYSHNLVQYTGTCLHGSFLMSVQLYPFSPLAFSSLTTAASGLRR